MRGRAHSSLLLSHSSGITYDPFGDTIQRLDYHAEWGFFSQLLLVTVSTPLSFATLPSAARERNRLLEIRGTEPGSGGTRLSLQGLGREATVS